MLQRKPLSAIPFRVKLGRRGGEQFCALWTGPSLVTADEFSTRCGRGRMPESIFTDLQRRVATAVRRRCLLLGVCGSGMKSLVPVLLQAGHQVVGTDRAIHSGVAAPCAVRCTSHAGNRHSSQTHQGANGLAAGSLSFIAEGELPRQAPFDVAIRSLAVPESSDCVLRLRRDGVPVITLHAALADLFARRDQICVAGTHGKSTTSALLAWILHGAGRDPGFFVGADVPDLHSGGRLGRGREVVVESCEFSRSFCQLSPRHVVLTNVDRDHFDCFPDERSEDAAFGEFISRMDGDGLLLISGDCQRRTYAQPTMRA